MHVTHCNTMLAGLLSAMMNNLYPDEEYPEEQQSDMQATDAFDRQEGRASVYTGPIVICAFAVHSAIAGGISEALGAETAADASFTFAAGCALGAVGGAVFAYRKSRKTPR
jgi:hypothetical protein